MTPWALRLLVAACTLWVAAAAVTAQPAQPAPVTGLPSCPGTNPQNWNQCIGTLDDRSRDLYYAGEFRDGRPSGLGILRAGATLYTGEFLEGRYHGHGILTMLGDRAKYVGQFRQGVMHGQGTITRADGTLVQSGRYEEGVLRRADPAPPPAPVMAPSAPPGAPPGAPPSPALAAPTSPLPAAAGPPAGSRQAVPAATGAPGFVAGRVTLPDGSPLAGELQEVSISITGVSMAGERVSYSPELLPDGRYRQRVAAGQYRFGGGTVTVRLGDRVFRLPLEPVGERWNRNRDAAEGIVQDFVWRTTGATPYGRSSGQNENNHTHWYGAHVSMGWQVWRADTKRPTTPPPEGTRLRFNVRPVSPTVDGRVLAPFIVERDWNPRSITPMKDLHDLPPADLEITGVALLPDGTSKPLLFQGVGDYPNFRPVLRAPLTPPGGVSGSYSPLNAGWVLE